MSDQTDNVERLARALCDINRSAGEDITSREVTAALDALGLEVNKAGTAESLVDLKDGTLTMIEATQAAMRGDPSKLEPTIQKLSRLLDRANARRSGHLVPAESGWREADIETAAMAMFRANGGKSKLAYLNDDQNDARDDELLKVYRKLARAAADVFTPPTTDTPEQPDRVAELEGEVERLREALKPFLFLFDRNDDGKEEDQLEGLPDGHAFEMVWESDEFDKAPVVTVGQVRRARTALGGES